MFPGKSVLAVGAHPDDIEFAIMGTLLKLKREFDSKIYCYIGSMGGKGDPTSTTRRKVETFKALTFLSPEEIFFNNAIGIVTYHKHVKEIEKIVKEHNISLVLTIGGNDTHQDHKLMSDICMTALRKEKVSVWYYALNSGVKGFVPDMYIDITRYYQEKRKAIQTHLSQSNKYFMSDEYMGIFNSDQFAALHGIRYVERFKVERIFL